MDEICVYQVPDTGVLKQADLLYCIVFLYLLFIMWWSKEAVKYGELHLFCFSPGSSYCSGDVCGFLAMAWRSDIPSTPTLAANVPISGLLRRGGCMGGGEHRGTRGRGERARARASI